MYGGPTNKPVVENLALIAPLQKTCLLKYHSFLANLESPVIEADIDILLHTLERARGYQPGHPYLDLSHRLPLESGHQHTEGLDGNLGAILFCDEIGGLLGTNWIAASARLRPLIAAQAATMGDTIVYLNGNDKQRKVQWVMPGAKPIGKSAVIAPSDPKSKNDSEIVLLNALHVALTHMGNPRGRAVLLTERMPCVSCTDVIRSFVQQNSNVNLSVAYLADYVNSSLQRSHVEFHAQLTAAQVTNVSLFKVDEVTSGYFEIAEVGVGAPLHRCRTANFGMGTGLWCGTNPDGTPKFAAWELQHYVSLRRMLRYPISDQD